jgi:hypothetical protein
MTGFAVRADEVRKNEVAPCGIATGGWSGAMEPDRGRLSGLNARR